MSAKQGELFDDMRRVPKGWKKYTRVYRCVLCGNGRLSTIVPAPLCQDCAPPLGEEEDHVIMASCGLRRTG